MRESTKDALNRYSEKQAREADPLRVRRKNEKPEFEFKKICLKWLAVNGWIVSVVESKGVYNFAAGRYDTGQTEQGFSDLVGVTPYRGVAAFLELKAPGQRSQLKPHQRDFLVARINAEAFAVCVDSTELLAATFFAWRVLRIAGKTDEAKAYLKNALPKVKDRIDRLDELWSE